MRARLSSTTEKYQRFRMSARHQNGPRREGKIIDGCVTCRWQGYQYFPEEGASPPPLTEKSARFKRGSLLGACRSMPDRTRHGLGSSHR
jgi:hypothetical protein